MSKNDQLKESLILANEHLKATETDLDRTTQSLSEHSEKISLLKLKKQDLKQELRALRDDKLELEV